MSTVHTHVQCVIGVLKQKYTILKHILPISWNADKDEYQANIDNIVRVWLSSVRSTYHKTNKTLGRALDPRANGAW